MAVEGGIMFAAIAAFIYFPLVLRSEKYKV
jgi:hypothetical protein